MPGGPVPELGTGRENPTTPGPEVIIVSREDIIITPPPITPESLPPEATPPGLPEYTEPIRTVDTELPKETPDRTDGMSQGSGETKAPTEPMPTPAAVPPHAGPRESGAEPLSQAPGDARPSPQDSHDTNGKSTESTSRAGDSRTAADKATTEKPSLLQRLAAYKAQIDAKDAPEKGRETSRNAEKATSKGGKRVAGKNAGLPKPAGKGGKRLKPAVR